MEVDTSTEAGGRATAVEVVAPGEQADARVNGPSAMLSWRRLETPPPTGTFSCIHSYAMVPSQRTHFTPK